MVHCNRLRPFVTLIPLTLLWKWHAFTLICFCIYRVLVYLLQFKKKYFFLLCIYRVNLTKRATIIVSFLVHYNVHRRSSTASQKTKRLYRAQGGVFRWSVSWYGKRKEFRHVKYNFLNIWRIFIEGKIPVCIVKTSNDFLPHFNLNAGIKSVEDNLNGLWKILIFDVLLNVGFLGHFLGFWVY